MSTIKLYINTTENERIDKSSYVSDLTAKTVTGTFKNPVDILNPTVQFELPISDLGKYNYMYISDFGRYYFITGWTMISGATYAVSDPTALFEITSHVDVLYTYKTKITANSGFVRRNQSRLNPYVVDREVSFRNDVTRTYKTFSSDPFLCEYDTSDVDSPNKNNIVMVIANNVTEGAGTYAKPTGLSPFIFPNPYMNTLSATRTAYCMNYGKAQAILNYLNSNQLNNAVIKELFGQTAEAIVSIIAFPFDVKAHSSSAFSPTINNVYIGDYQLPGLEAWEIHREYNQVFTFGSIDLTSDFTSDFRSFEPFTTYELYLPYIGWTRLDASDVSGKKIGLKYVVDLLTGDCEAIVFNYNSESQIFKTQNGKIGIHCPITSSNANEIARNGMLAALAMSQNPSGAYFIAASSFISNPYKITGDVPSSGIGMWMPSKAILIVSTQTQTNLTDLASVRGYECDKTYTLSTLSGYTEIGKIHLENMDPATKTETDEIISLLSNGVIM